MSFNIGAVILAAGMSTRMARPKMVLPWGDTTVLGHVVDVLTSASVSPIVVVTGGAEALVQASLFGKGVMFVHNPDFETGEMLASLQCGLRFMPGAIDGTLVVLGDQPQIQQSTIQDVIGRYLTCRSRIIVPSFQMRRGHPWLIDRSLWGDFLAEKTDQTMRGVLAKNISEIDYVVIDNDSIFRDLDTPEDYEAQRPG